MTGQLKISILGAGNIGESLLKGMLASGLYTNEEVIVSDISEERLAHIKDVYGVETTLNNAEAVASSKYVIVAVKPGVVKYLLEGISPSLNKSKLVISVAAGTPVRKIRKWSRDGAPVIRVMPNTPVMVMEGASVISPGPDVKSGDIEDIRKIFGSVGKAIVLDEEYLNAVTGLSGSGPAYVFTIIEALADGGVKAGLPRDTAILLAAQTVLGAAKMVLTTGKHTGKLKDMVTSPSGTTIEGIYRLEASGIRAALMDAVEKAAKRAEDLEKGE